jgi:hypothetical protein
LPIAGWLPHASGMFAVTEAEVNPELGLFAASAFDAERRERPAVVEYHLVHQHVGGFADAEDILQSAVLQSGDGGRRDHAAVGDDTDQANAENAGMWYLRPSPRDDDVLRFCQVDKKVNSGMPGRTSSNWSPS